MIHVIKANGEKELFSEDKLLSSIKRAGIPEDMHDQVINYIKHKLFNNITTKEIYHFILEFLEHSHNPYTGAKYSLKQAIMDFGPTGYPFEDFVAHIFAEQGYQTSTRNIIRGKCITHEIDVIATKNENGTKKTIIVEAKFHNRLGVTTDSHVAMYTKARFDDVKEKNDFAQVWLITNTKLSTDAIAYANCTGMRIIDWNYPQGHGLRELVEQYQLHPITTLKTLSQFEKQQLLNQGLVLCRDLCKKQPAFDALDLSPEKRFHVLKEAAFACSLHKGGPI